MHAREATCLFASTLRALCVIASSQRGFRGWGFFLFFFMEPVYICLHTFVCILVCMRWHSKGQWITESFLWIHNWLIHELPLKKDPSGSCHSTIFIQISATLFYLQSSAERGILFLDQHLRRMGFLWWGKAALKKTYDLFLCSSTWDSRAW